MDQLRLNLLPLGYLECQYFRIVNCAESHVMYRSPVTALLIRHPELGNVLYDTGNSPYNKWEYGEHINAVYPVKKFISIEQALSDFGLSCADIDLLILSHLHFDHCGGLKYFIGTKAAKNVLVARKELANACSSVFLREEDSAYVQSLFDIDAIKYTLVDEDRELAPDLKLFIQNSHTPGVTGLLISTQSMGKIIVTSDSVYTQTSWDQEVPPGGSINKTPEEFFHNLTRLKAMRKEHNAAMLFGHDERQVTDWVARGDIF